MNPSDYYNRYKNRSIERKYKSAFKQINRWINYYRVSFPGSPERLATELFLEGAKFKELLQKNPRLANKFLPKIFAIFSETSRLYFGYAPNRTQLLGAILLWHGKAVEMKSGEGKTLTAAMVAYLQGLTGQGMHIVTTNDYLAERDKEWMSILYNRLGVSCGAVMQTTAKEIRKNEYAKDITYVSNQEIGFDYLRDNLAIKKEDRVLRGFPFAIVDEIDSILIDEARMPLIISRPVASSNLETLPNILRIVPQLKVNRDYEIDYRFKTVNFTDEGVASVVKMLGRDIFSELDLSAIGQLRYALFASSFLKNDRDFIIDGGKIVLVDEFTGHRMADRRLLNGLQQIVEATSGVPVREEDSIAATITYRDLFNMYEKIAGMSGTVMLAKEEFSDLYNLDAQALMPNRPVKRVDMPVLFFKTEREKFDFIISSILETHASNDPILIVGRSVAQAEHFSDLIKNYGLSHQLLNAKFSESEFEIVKNAGNPGAVTVATNMAGRGMDILLSERQKETNGLIVYSLEPNLSKRIDDQLRGRSGRQGNAGKSLSFASLEDEIFQVYADDNFWDYAEKINWNERGVADKKLEKFLGISQDIADAIAAEMRGKSVQIETVLNNYGKIVSKLRDEMLSSENCAICAANHIGDIFNEFSKELNNRNIFSMRAEVIKMLKDDAVWNYNASGYSFNLMKTLLRFIFGVKSESDALEIRTASASYAECERRIKEQILALSDNLWENYLEDADDLQDRIFIEAAAERPFDRFAKESSEIFHDMRRKFARLALRILFDELNNFNKENI